MAKASLHVKRHLQAVELLTITIALEHWRRTPLSELSTEVLDRLRASGDLLSAAEIETLEHELLAARKVKVCRSKQPEV